jgi:5-methylcytosine-specific restriction endonuclease McrA
VVDFTPLLLAKMRRSQITSNARAYTYKAKGLLAVDDLVAVYVRQFGCCYYCADQLTPNNFTVEHVVPMGQGGSNAPENIAAACMWCNNKKNHVDHFALAIKSNIEASKKYRDEHAQLALASKKLVSQLKELKSKMALLEALQENYGKKVHHSKKKLKAALYEAAERRNAC